MCTIDKRPLVLLGGGGHCRAAIDVLNQLKWPVLGILDNTLHLREEILGVPVIGTDDNITDFIEYPFLVTVGQIKSHKKRKYLHELIIKLGGEMATIISPKAHVSSFAKIESGTLVMNFANVSANAIVGKGCIINSYADIEHDAKIGNYCHISTGAIVNGSAEISDGCFVGSHATIYQESFIPPFSVIPAAAVVKNKNLNLQ